jgi:hypothetical protein
MMREDDPPGTRDIKYYRADMANRGEIPILKVKIKKAPLLEALFDGSAAADRCNIVNQA